MKTRMKLLLPFMVLVGALSVGHVACAQQSGTADEAKALLARAATAVKTDRAGALAKFDAPNGGFKDRDLYVFCFDRKTGTVLAGQPATKGKDVRTYVDSTGKRFGQEMFANVRTATSTSSTICSPNPTRSFPSPSNPSSRGLETSPAASATTIAPCRRRKKRREWAGNGMPAPS